MKRTDTHRPSAINPDPVTVQLHGTGLRGLGVPQIISRFFGDLSQWPVESDLKKFTQAKILAIAEHIDRTGDCLWHAEFVVMGGDKCHCAKCTPMPKSVRGVA